MLDVVIVRAIASGEGRGLELLLIQDVSVSSS